MSPTASAGPRDDVDADHFRLERYQGERRQSAPLRTFYAVKPAVPRRMQLGLRRLYARRQARRRFPAWPVEPVLVDRQRDELRRRLRAGQGDGLEIVNFWPGGHRFAAILTHDVEGPAGVANIAAVRDIERRYGLVSSWNFVAEDYPIPEGTFASLRADGCEIGLHGIHHDGRLFRDRASFAADLPKIHDYLQRWDAAGFRSPATHRNADWMPELGCLYDSSFPDTDPFEPQSGGCCSIFPFFIGSVVELPITLAQDHTVFEILREDSIRLWTQKTDWIIREHGLVNVIVHPDYLLSDERMSFYDQFLAHLRERIDRDGGWHALPRDVAHWWSARAAVTDESGVAVPGAALPGEATTADVSEVDGAVVIAPR
jgi:peptidoglycan/xylan/chitin deacetylase (PgdA/CDA1 family)